METALQNSNRDEVYTWINVAKTCAVCGVVLQHVRGYVYSSDYIFYSVWWVVPIFILIGGYNAISSYINRGSFCLKRKLIRIIVPYFFCTLLYVAYNFRYLDAIVFLKSLISFDASPPLYYVAVYIQLLCISPILIAIAQKCNRKKLLLSWVIIIAASAVSTRYTNIFNIIIGGGYLFAGPWILFWYLGICIRQAESHISISLKCRKYVVTAITILLVGWQYLFVNRGWNR